MARKRLYIIGPISGKPRGNRPAFEAARKQLSRAGYEVRIPQDFVGADTCWAEAMNVSLHVLTDYQPYRLDDSRRFAPYWDGVVLLDGWEGSTGAFLEKQVAHALEIPCMTVDDWLRSVKPVKAQTNRAKLRGKPLDPECKGAKTTTHEYGPKDGRIFCYGLTAHIDGGARRDTRRECKKCNAYIMNARPLEVV